MADNKYRVIKRLQVGGMAEVYVGESASVQGFKKKVAIKRVLPHLAQNENFIAMFLDEARLSAKLDHANIVSVFDISAREDTYFLIMEYVDGANLKQIMDGLNKRGQRMQLGEAAFICIEACRGLSYAHELAGEDGELLNIVHRDISPPNIMVTKRGEVKVADFGLAKAGTQISTTDPGVVKGKFSYLSPEAANGLEVDARADIFSLGIVLWEMLSARRLFLGENDYSTVKLIQQANIPRLAPLNRGVDEEFEEVLLRALTQDPKHRYGSAREFGDALAGYLYSHQLKVTSYDIANLVTGATNDTGPSSSASTEMSLIDRLIQDELDESVKVESSSGPVPLGGRDSEPAEVGLGLEDPASWFSEDDLGKSEAPPPPTAANDDDDDDDDDDLGESPSGSWRESGLATSPGEGGAQAQPEQPEQPEQPADAEPPPEAEQESQAEQAPPKADAAAKAPAAKADDGMGAGLYIAIVGAAAMAAGAAWFISTM